LVYLDIGRSTAAPDIAVRWTLTDDGFNDPATPTNGLAPICWLTEANASLAFCLSNRQAVFVGTKLMDNSGSIPGIAVKIGKIAATNLLRGVPVTRTHR